MRTWLSCRASPKVTSTNNKVDEPVLQPLDIRSGLYTQACLEGHRCCVETNSTSIIKTSVRILEIVNHIQQLCRICGSDGGEQRALSGQSALSPDDPRCAAGVMGAIQGFTLRHEFNPPKYFSCNSHMYRYMPRSLESATAARPLARSQNRTAPIPWLSSLFLLPFCSLQRSRP